MDEAYNRIIEKKHYVDLGYRACGLLGAVEDAGNIRSAIHSLVDKAEYSFGFSCCRIAGLDVQAMRFISNCPSDCVIVIMDNNPLHYNACVTHADGKEMPYAKLF